MALVMKQPLCLAVSQQMGCLVDGNASSSRCIRKVHEEHHGLQVADRARVERKIGTAFRAIDVRRGCEVRNRCLLRNGREFGEAPLWMSRATAGLPCGDYGLFP